MMSCVDADNDYLYDPIQLNFEESEPLLENVEFLDPGIIDNGCDSDQLICDSELYEDTTDYNLCGGATSLGSVTTTMSNKGILKPMCIKLVDCYKFPSYFDQYTKDIIKNKLIISNNVNISHNEEIVQSTHTYTYTDSSDDLTDVSNEFVYELSDNNTFCKSRSINEKSRDTIDVRIDFNELNKDSDNWKKGIGMNRISEPLSMKMRVFDHSKRVEKRKKELDWLIAMSQRNKTKVDIKKNIGLVGMKVQRMATGRRTSDLKCKTINQTNDISITQDTNNVHLEAVDKVLIDNKTTLTPVSNKGGGRSTKESEMSILTVPQDYCQSAGLLVCAKSGADIKYIPAHRDKVEEAVLDKSTKIAAEIVRIISSESNGISQINEGHKNNKEKTNYGKPMPFSKKIENELKLRRLDVIKDTLKQQKDTKECKTTKMIIPIPLSTKARNRKKQTKSTKSPIQSLSSAPKSSTTNITLSCTNSHDVKKQESEKPEISKVNPFKPASPCWRSNTNMLGKSFTTLNKFTEKILNKIQATKKSQLNKSCNLDKKHTKTKTLTAQPNSKNKCKSLSGVTTKNVSTESKRSITMSPKMTSTQPQYSDQSSLEKSPKMNQIHLDSHHVQLAHHIEQSTLPLNKIVMNTEKTDCAKINIETSSNVVNTHDYATNSTSPTIPRNISQTNKEQTTTNITGAITSQKQSINVFTLEDIGNIEENMKTKENLKQPLPSSIAASIFKDRDRQTIQTVIATPNEFDAGKLSHEVNNLTHQTRAPQTQVSAITVRPTQTQNRLAEANKPLTVHNSMQSHILYRPQAPSNIFLNNMEALQYQNPMAQMNRPVYQSPVNPNCYPSWYPERVTPHTAIGRPPNGLNGIIPAQVTSNTFKTTTGNDEQITPNIEISLKPLKVGNGTPFQIDARQMPNRMIPIHNNMAFNNKPPPGVCYMQPNTVFWSPAFPPPNFSLPPPAFLPPCSQETMPPTSSSIIGRNNEGTIKKINLSTQVFDHSTITDSIKSNFNSRFAPDVVPVAQENSRLANSKSEMLRVLDTSMNQTQSLVNHSENTVSMPSKLLTCPNELKSSLHFPSSTRLAKIPKHEKSPQNVQPTPFESNRSKNIKQEVLPNDTPKKEAALQKITVPVEAKIHREFQSKTPQVKSNRSSGTDSGRLFEDNSKSVHSLKKKSLTDTISRLTKVIHSKEIPINSEVNMKTNKRESQLIENGIKPDSISQNTEVASPVNLKRALPMDQTENTPSMAKYKPGPLSKRNKLYNSKGRPNEIKTDQKILPNKGYSAPILPIPTYEKILSELPASACIKLFDKPVVEPSKIRISSDKADTLTNKVSNESSNKPIKKRKHLELSDHKADKAKKISFEEYKKRSTNERKKDRDKNFKEMKGDSFKKSAAYTPRRPSYVDSDLGYDSDSTVKL